MLVSERANQSIQQLSSALEQLSSDGEEVEEPRGSGGSLFATMAKEDKGAWSQKTQSEAVQQEGRSNLTAFQDLVPMIHNQSDYIQHLEAEVKLCKEELHEMKQRIRVVVVENERFHSDLKSKAVDESLKEYTIHNSMVMSVYSISQKECEEVKDRLRHREKQAADALRADGAPRVAGLCLKCAQHEAVLAGTHTNLHVQAIDRLKKERDELLVALRAVRASQQEAQQREWSACLQVKQAVEMAEEANLYKARVEVQCEQLSRELARLREQLEREAQALKERLAEAREEGRAEARKQREELAQTVSSLSQHVAELEGELDRAHRDRSSLTSQLEDTLRKLTSQEQDNTKVDNLKWVVVKDSYASSFSPSISAGQEVERLSSELVGCRQHLEVVQKDGSQWQAEALSLAEQLANAQRQLHLTRQDRESSERAHEEEMASATLSARERERELALLLQQTEAQHQQRVGESEGLLSSQNSLIRRLKEECCALGVKLEELTESRALEQLALEKQHLLETVKGLRARCSDTEDQCVQHGRMHQRMKNRLQQLDRHCQSSAQQVYELLAKQNQLIQERNTLTEEMQSLHMEVHRLCCFSMNL
uniref:SHH signaling and ciliogenesis regulator sdccag8 n=1 Tax=Cyclopterus lumpus TaxID=8103 RepID=A0A8C2WS09_CYCLU